MRNQSSAKILPETHLQFAKQEVRDRHVYERFRETYSTHIRYVTSL